MPAPALPTTSPTSPAHPTRPTLPAGPTGATLTWPAFAALVRRLALRSGAAGPDGTLVVAVDGFSGAGKTWLSARLAAALRAELVHVDAFVPGWHGLDEGIRAVGRDLVGPWSRGQEARPRLYDWDAASAGRQLALAPPRTAVLEGCGIASLGSTAGLAVRLWVHAPPHLRARRLDGREDRDAYLPHRAAWARQEAELARRHRTPHRCDLRVLRAETTGVQVTAAPPGPDPDDEHAVDS